MKHFSFEEEFSEIISQIHIDLHSHYSYQILMKLENFMDRSLHNTQISNFMKIRPMGASGTVRIV